MITLQFTRAQVQDLYLTTLYVLRNCFDIDDMEEWNDLANMLFDAMDAYDKKHDD